MSSQTSWDSKKCVSEGFGSQLLLLHIIECQQGYGGQKVQVSMDAPQIRQWSDFFNLIDLA